MDAGRWDQAALSQAITEQAGEEPDTTRFVRLLRTATHLFVRHGAERRVEVIPI